jgi:uncharacterized protein
MNEQQSLELVKEGYSFFQKGDFSSMFDLYAEEVEFVFPGPPGIIPYAGTHRGKAQVREFFQLLNDNLKFDQFEPKEFFFKDNKVVVLGHLHGKSLRTGQTVEDDWVHVFTLQNNKVVRLQSFSDTAKAVASFGQEKAEPV